MIVGLADTHIALWHLLNRPKLSVAADSFLLSAGQAGHSIAVSSVSLVEVIYLVDKGRLPYSAYQELLEALANPAHMLVESPVSAKTAEAMWHISRNDVPDMPDRIIAATGIELGVPVISCDGRIRANSLTTIW